MRGGSYSAYPGPGTSRPGSQPSSSHSLTLLIKHALHQTQGLLSLGLCQGGRG